MKNFNFKKAVSFFAILAVVLSFAFGSTLNASQMQNKPGTTTTPTTTTKTGTHKKHKKHKKGKKTKKTGTTTTTTPTTTTPNKK